MKKEKVQNTSEKRSVNDFEHRMTIQLTEQHYIDYAMAHSQDQTVSYTHLTLPTTERV